MSAATGGVLLLGATGRTGRRLLQQLLERGVPVRAIVRSAERLPAGVADDPRLTVVEAEVASLAPDELGRYVADFGAVISCLGHSVSLRGVFGPPRDLLPPARDNQCAADFLAREVGADHPSVAWAVVRPDTLVDGEASAYATHEGIVASLLRPATTRMANVARFMTELATDDDAWLRWRGQMPVIVDDPSGSRT